ncbi:glycosyltransferase family 2 protein [Spirochaeta lutea]|uniref:glycosyltransferase family 2 protein n=1 Tax=Spirochaeta lutea TaxID=1480694 RepID=UPI0009DCBE91|nr:glycosyltransferase family 2 protein [Spirochaeta lutea]
MFSTLEYILTASFIVLNVAGFVGLIISKSTSRGLYLRQSRILSQIAQAMANRDLGSLPKYSPSQQGRNRFLSRIRDHIRLPVSTLGDTFTQRIEKLFYSRGYTRPREAAALLVLLPRQDRVRIARQVVEQTQGPWSLLIRITSVLVDSGDMQSIDIDRLHQRFSQAPERWQTRLARLLEGCPQTAYRWYRRQQIPPTPLAKRIGVVGIPCCTPEEARSYLIPLLLYPAREVHRNAALMCGQFHPWIFSETPNQALFSAEVRRIGVKALLRSQGRPSWQTLEGWLSFPELSDLLAGSFTAYIRRDPSLLTELIVRLRQAIAPIPETSRDASHVGFRRAIGIARILEPSLSYILLHGRQRIQGYQQTDLALLIRVLIAGQRRSAVIRLINSLSSQEDVLSLKDVITQAMIEDPDFAQDCRRLLRPKAKESLGITGNPEPPVLSRKRLGWSDRILLSLLALGTLSLLPALFALLVSLGAITGGIEAFLVFYQRSFIGYSLAINGSYLVFLVISMVSASKKNRVHHWQESGFFAKPGVLPKVSIIAPGYNEETTIVQSVQSLLNLEYPDFEVIVVNDGSKDRTLGVLQQEFDLEPRDDRSSQGSIPILTAPIMGVYKSRVSKDLTVVDKVNGGKADSLNAGILQAQGDYVVCIDSDSLLEPKSLLHLMRSTLDTDEITLAIGGNIVPVNGCLVSKGSIREIHPPRNPLALIQTMEYLRAFIIGRMGWAGINGLLIISGAFGAFQRQAVLEIGGYLTGSGPRHLDTVGEDMEIVVRLRKHLYSKGIKHRVQYVHTANCWTEVPEHLPSLLIQRDRWNRGLMEVLMIHKDMLLRRPQGVPGLISLPYFFIFELLGPFLETGGYLAAFLAVLLGIANLPTLALLFAVSVGLGTFISMMSLLVADKNVLYFRGRDFRRVLGASIIENFGYRQLFGMHRVWSFIRYIFKEQGWKQPPRKGFQSQTDGPGETTPHED